MSISSMALTIYSLVMFGGIIQLVIKNKQLDINKEEASLKRQNPSKRGVMHVKDELKGPRAFRSAILEVSS